MRSLSGSRRSSTLLLIPIVQRFLEAQARQLAEAYVERALSVRFTLPDRVVCSPNEKEEAQSVAATMREQHVRDLRERTRRP